MEKVELGVFDDTFDATLELWSCLAASASHWKPLITVLLLVNPGLRGEGRPVISVWQKTCVEVDPFFRDAFWLRSFGKNLTKREHVNPDFPKDGKVSSTLVL